MPRDFKGIWIPAEIWLNKDMTIMEKVFFVEIDSLDNKDGCIASNNYFAKFFGVTAARCSQIINSLIKKEYAKARYEYNGKEVKLRVLNIFNRGIKYSKQGIKKMQKGYKENAKGINISNNTYNNILKEYTKEFEKKLRYSPNYSKYNILEKKCLKPIIEQYGEQKTIQMVQAYFKIDFYKDSCYPLTAWQTPAVINQILKQMPKIKKQLSTKEMIDLERKKIEEGR